MTDLFLKTTDKAILAAVLDPYLQEEETFGTYFQNEQFAVDWIGQVPKTYDEEGNVIAWASGLHFNVRCMDPEAVSVFSGFQSIHPETPYRIFG